MPVLDHPASSVAFLDASQSKQASASSEASSFASEKVSTRIPQRESLSSDNVTPSVLSDVSPVQSVVSATPVQQGLCAEADGFLFSIGGIPSAQVNAARHPEEDEIRSGNFAPRVLETRRGGVGERVSCPRVCSSRCAPLRAARSLRKDPPSVLAGCMTCGVVTDVSPSSEKGHTDAVEDSDEYLAAPLSTFGVGARKFHAADVLPRDSVNLPESRRYRTSDGCGGYGLCGNQVPCSGGNAYFPKPRSGLSKRMSFQLEAGTDADPTARQEVAYGPPRCSTGSEREWKTADTGWERTTGKDGGFRPCWLSRWRRRKGPRYTPLNGGRRIGSFSCPAVSPAVLQHAAATEGRGSFPVCPKMYLTRGDGPRACPAEDAAGRKHHECDDCFTHEHGTSLHFRRSRSTGTLDKSSSFLLETGMHVADTAEKPQATPDEERFGNRTSRRIGSRFCRLQGDPPRGWRHLRAGNNGCRSHQRRLCTTPTLRPAGADEREVTRGSRMPEKVSILPNVTLDLLELSDGECERASPQTKLDGMASCSSGGADLQGGQGTQSKNTCGDRIASHEQSLPFESEHLVSGASSKVPTDGGEGLTWKNSFASCSSLSLQSDEEDVEVYGRGGGDASRLQLLEEVCVCGVSLPWTSEKQDEASSSDRGQSPATTGQVLPASKTSVRGGDATRDSKDAPPVSVRFNDTTVEMGMPRSAPQVAGDTLAAVPHKQRGRKGDRKSETVPASRLRYSEAEGQLSSGLVAGIPGDTPPQKLNHAAQAEPVDTSKVPSNEGKSARHWSWQGKGIFFQSGRKAQSLTDSKLRQEKPYDHEQHRGDNENPESTSPECGQRGTEQEEDQQSLEEQLTLQESRLLELAKDLRSIARRVYTKRLGAAVGIGRHEGEEEKASGQTERADEVGAKGDTDEEDWREKSGTARMLEQWAKGGTEDPGQAQEEKHLGTVANVYQPDYTAVTGKSEMIAFGVRTRA